MTENTAIRSLAIKKAMQSDCTYKISAIGFNSKGDVIGSAINRKHRFGRYNGLHAEIALIKKYHGIASVLICRVNKTGKLLPIDPCPRCKKLLDNMGIRIYTLKEDI